MSSDKPLTDIIERFIELMIKADPRGVLYSPLINRNLMKLLRLPIDMKPCLLSALVMHKIENSKYENYSMRKRVLLDRTSKPYMRSARNIMKYGEILHINYLNAKIILVTISK